VKKDEGVPGIHLYRAEGEKKVGRPRRDGELSMAAGGSASFNVLPVPKEAGTSD